MGGGLHGLGTGLSALVLLAANPAPSADVVIEGCNEGALGEIGIRELVGAVGDTVGVAVTVHASNEIDSFSLDIDFPSDLVRFLDAEPGELTSHFLFFGGSYVTQQDQVRLGGADVDSPIPLGSFGRLGIVRFEVIAPGAGAFATLDYLDDLAPYSSCEQAHGTTPVRVATWGHVKIRYR
jgi:hypothetical protein